ncbi:MAG TPA: DUF6662 family protein [Chthoniobacterales bacterium]
MPSFSSHRLILLAAGILLALWPTSAQADENLFGYAYGAETLPKGHWEVYNWATGRFNKGQGTYRALDLAQEFEYGITDRWQASFYVTERAHKIQGSAPIEDGEPEYPDRSSFKFQGLQLATKYMILSPFQAPVGLAVYGETGWSRNFKISGQQQDEYFFEGKIILQKNFLEDQLITVLNVTGEYELRRLRGESDQDSEVEFEVTSGVAYRVARNWYLGIEGRMHSEFPNSNFGDGWEHYAIFAGPVIHYGAKRWWATLTWLPQITGWPNDPERSNNLHLDEHEKYEIRLKVGFNF